MPLFRRRSFEAIPGWMHADHAAAFAAFRQSARRFLTQPSSDASHARPVSGSVVGAFTGSFAAAARAALADEASVYGGHAARAFFESHFVALRVLPDEAAVDDPEPGFVTGYYEPVLPASRERTDRFRTPLYAPPDDLVILDDVSRPPGVDPTITRGRRRGDGVMEAYPDRAAIADGALADRGLELVWLESAVDAFFVHVQGSARLSLEDGGEMRVGFAGRNGHPYTSIARVLIEMGELSRDEADMAGLRAWLADNPDRIQTILNRNRSYIFFQAKPLDDRDLGPVGAAGVGLTPLASLAVDDAMETYGVPYFVSASRLSIAGVPFRRLMIAQDTGAAITGPARGDIFVGSGEAAGALAGTIRHDADFTILVPPALADRLAP